MVCILIYSMPDMTSILSNAYANYERTSDEEQYALVKAEKKFIEIQKNPL